jgi:hypothetical protein
MSDTPSHPIQTPLFFQPHENFCSQDKRQNARIYEAILY